MNSGVAYEAVLDHNDTHVVATLLKHFESFSLSTNNSYLRLNMQVEKKSSGILRRLANHLPRVRISVTFQVQSNKNKCASKLYGKIGGKVSFLHLFISPVFISFREDPGAHRLSDYRCCSDHIHLPQHKLLEQRPGCIAHRTRHRRGSAPCWRYH